MKLSKSINASLHQSPLGTLSSSRAKTNRFKISENLQVTKTEKTKNSNNSNHSFLRRIGTRLKHKDQDVPPELAAKVVKSYILPMFENETRNKFNLQRTEAFGHKHQFSADGTTVYSELKLSEKLSKELLNLESQLISLDQQVKDNTQEKEKITQENQKLELDLLNSQTNVLFLTNENTRLQRELIGFKLSLGQISTQLKKYKSLYEETRTSNEKITKQLQDQKATNDIR
ncbi:hypothetical protein SteCoe_37681 [Stentor coeruleus]|uniref:Uncharacterized protein n=1 Tax=Stentor coeruleus TaxID=5963 RepID=A0A1R2AMU8_9CILI|nr:hypothetical protein SteCoe_37681 [Stentor coeruleus]